ncbi:hypothetical protein [Candidatus Parabeggiatoa sp. HSG14]|uniref:hypothetical protein n=1 Tax=Candidatus Parabeggiatoa sp. HSG14 TaxID=3055593 RepID=UPI0025A84E40|nr:hypothetical protein [Thiotrichales bacterium HSG14]
MLDSNSPKSKSNFDILMLELFYPAVLGSIAYSVLKALSTEMEWVLVLQGCIVFHFCVDYIYTYVLSNGWNGIGKFSLYIYLKRFFYNILILLLLYLAFAKTKKVIDIDYFKISLYFSLVYFLFILNDITLITSLDDRKNTGSNKSLSNSNCDEKFGFLPKLDFFKNWWKVFSSVCLGTTNKKNCLLKFFSTIDFLLVIFCVWGLYKTDNIFSIPIIYIIAFVILVIGAITYFYKEDVPLKKQILHLISFESIMCGIFLLISLYHEQSHVLVIVIFMASSIFLCLSIGLRETLKNISSKLFPVNQKVRKNK